MTDAQKRVNELMKNCDSKISLNDPIRTIHEDRGYKDCLCCVCKKVSQCTPENDFYSTDDHGQELVCELCFKKYLKSQHGINDMVYFTNTQRDGM